ncbi:E3 ubiquitin-protein ligase tom1, partial [Spiromyces aspiralis]
MAIKIMARLIHNEPTSLSILQEDTLPSTFLRQLGEFIPYSMDTLIAIPNALGALCLNQVGYDQVMKSNVASKLFETITQIEYVKILQEGDGMCELGMELDEFMRHFSSARPAIMDLVVKYLQNIVELGTERPDKITAYNPGFSSMYASQEEYANKAAREDLYGLMIDSSTLFLDGMLGQDFHAKEAAESGAWEAIIAMLRSPLLALNFEGSTRIFEVFINLSRMILKASEKGTEVLVKELKRTLANEEFTEKCLSTESSLLVAYANPGDFPAESAKIHDTYLHQINVATCLVSLLAGYEDTPYDMSSSTAAQNYRTTASYLTRSEYYELVPRILKMYRAIVKEDILLHHREEAIKKLVSEKPSDDAGIPP